MPESVSWNPEFDLSNLARPEVLVDPYPWFHRMREAEPVRRDSSVNGWVVTRYDDCRSVLHDRSMMSGKSVTPEAAIAAGYEDLAPLYRIFQRLALFLDPPEHTWLRQLVSQAFTPRMSERMRSTIQEVADQLIDDVLDQGRMDLIADFAYTLPATVIVRMLGIPEQDVPLFRAWTDAVIPLATPVLPPAEQARELAVSVREFIEYMRELIAQRRVSPSDDLIGNLMTVEEDGRRLDEETLISNAMAMLIAGHETTKGVIGNGMHALLSRPEEFARLQAQPELAPSAVEEFLRHQTPFLFTYRAAREDTEIAGVPVAAGDPMFVLLAAANRDPSRFTDPDRLDIARPDNRHLAFGYSHHFCLGAHLGRIELDIVLRTLLARLPKLQLAEEKADWVLNFSIRTLRTLPVTF